MKTKVIGYVISVVGLLVLVFAAGGFNVPLIGGIDKKILNVLGMIAIGLGVVLVISSSEGLKGRRKGKGKMKDLPVYEGDDIVAYRRD